MGNLIGGPADGLECETDDRDLIQVTVLDGNAYQLLDGQRDIHLVDLLNRAAGRWYMYLRVEGTDTWRHVTPHQFAESP